MTHQLVKPEKCSYCDKIVYYHINYIFGRDGGLIKHPNIKNMPVHGMKPYDDKEGKQEHHCKEFNMMMVIMGIIPAEILDYSENFTNEKLNEI